MSEPLYLHVELRIAPAEMARFLETMQRVAPLIGEAGWTLIGAWRVRVGVANMLRVIWQVQDANAFFNERSALLAHPRFAEFRSVIDTAIEQETVSMMTAIPYGLPTRSNVPGLEQDHVI